MFLIFVTFLISIPFFVSANNKLRPIQDDVYQVMIDEANLKLKRNSNEVQRNAWWQLRKFEVIEKKCVITENFGKRVVSLINTYILHFTLLNFYPCIFYSLPRLTRHSLRIYWLHFYNHWIISYFYYICFLLVISPTVTRYILFLLVLFIRYILFLFVLFIRYIFIH